MKSKRLLLILIAVTTFGSSVSAEEKFALRLDPVWRGDMSVQNDVGRELGRTGSDRYAVLPNAWSALGLNSSRTVLSLRADVLQGTSIVYEHAGMLRSAQPMLAGLPVPHTTRMAVEFRPASLKNAVPLGALRMQMSGNSTLLLKPRSGGMSVSWRSQF